MSIDIPTLLEPGGPVLSFDQFMTLFLGACAEGVCKNPEDDGDAFSTPGFRREWEEMLAAIALFGPARAVVPTYLAGEFDIEPLIELGLAEIVTVETSPGLVSTIARTYEQAFNRFRELEWSLATTPLHSLNIREVSDNDFRSARFAMADAEYYIHRLAQLTTPILTGLSEVFGHYVAQNQQIHQGAMTDFVNATYPTPVVSDLDLTYRTDDVFRAMGLYVRDRAALERDGAGTLVHGLSYSPYFMSHLDEIDRALTTRATGYAEFAETSLMLSQFDPVEFISIHTFWRTLFELQTLLDLAGGLGSPLILPSGVPLRPSTAPSRTTRDAVRAYRLMLAESRRMPSPQDLHETARLLRDPGMKALREVLADWTSVAHDAGEDDGPVLAKIRSDIDHATRRLKRADGLTAVGRLVTVISLPVAVVDLMRGTALGTLLTPIGPAIDRYGAHQLKKAGWVRLGRP